MSHSKPRYFTLPEGETTIEIDLNHAPEEKEGDANSGERWVKSDYEQGKRVSLHT